MADDRIAIEIASIASLAGIEQSIALLRELGIQFAAVGESSGVAGVEVTKLGTGLARVDEVAGTSEAALGATDATIAALGEAATVAGASANILAEALERVSAAAAVLDEALGTIAGVAGELSAVIDTTGLSLTATSAIFERIDAVIATSSASVSAFAAASGEVDVALAAIEASGSTLPATLAAIDAAAAASATAIVGVGDAAAAAAVGIAAAGDALGVAAAAADASGTAAATAAVPVAALAEATDTQAIAATAAAEAQGELAAATALTGAQQDAAFAAVARTSGAMDEQATGALGLEAGLSKITIAAAALEAGLGALANQAGDFQTMLTNIQNNTTMSGEDIGKLSDAVFKLGSDTGAPLKDLASGFQHVMNISGDTTAALDVLNVATESAISTGGDASKTANVLGNALHEYGLDVSHAAWEQDRHNEVLGHAADMMNVFHQAAAQGNLTLEQFADNTGRVVGVAAGLGVPVEDISAAFVALSKHGFDAAESQTQLVNAMTHMINPTKQMQKEIERVSELTGVDLVGDFSAAGLHAKSFEGVLEDLRQAFQIMGLTEDGVTEESMKLINAQRGGLGVSRLLTTGYQDYVSILDNLNDKQAIGSVTTDAFARTQQTMGYQVSVMKNEMQELGITLGQAVLPQMNNWIMMIQNHVGELKDWAMHNQAVVSAIFEHTGQILLLLGAIKLVGPTMAAAQGAITAVSTAYEVGKAAVFGLTAAVKGQDVAVLMANGTFGANAAMLQFHARAEAEDTAAILFNEAAEMELAGATSLVTEAKLAEAIAMQESAASATGLSSGLSLATVAGGAIIPVAVLAAAEFGVLALETHHTNEEMKNFSKVLNDDLGKAIANIRVSMGDSFRDIFSATETSTRKSTEATQEWIKGADGQGRSAAELNAEMERLGRAYIANFNGSRDTREAIKASIDVIQQYQQAKADEYAMNERDVAFEAKIMDQRQKAYSQWLDQNTSYVKGMDAQRDAVLQAMDVAAAITAKQEEYNQQLGEGRIAGQGLTNAFDEMNAMIGDTQQRIDGLIASQGALSKEQGFMSGQTKLLTDGMDAYNAGLQKGIPWNAAMAGYYNQASKGAVLYGQAINQMNIEQYANAIAVEQEVEKRKAQIVEAARMIGASSAVGKALQMEADQWLATAQAILQETSALNEEQKAHTKLGQDIQTLTGIKKAYDDQVKAGHPLSEEQLKNQQAIDALLPKMQKDWDDQTKSIQDHQVKVIGDTQAADAAAKAFQSTHQPLIDAAVAMNDAAYKAGAMTKAQHDANDMMIHSADNAFALSDAIGKIPETHNTTITAQTAAALGNINDFLAHLDHIPTYKELVIAVITRGGDVGGDTGLVGITGRAGGGMVRAGEVTLVGERGPELVMLPAGARVVPNAESMQILNRGLAAGGIVAGGNAVASTRVDFGNPFGAGYGIGAGVDMGLVTGMAESEAAVIDAAVHLAKGMLDAIHAVLGGADAEKAASDAADLIGKVAGAVTSVTGALGSLAGMGDGPSAGQMSDFAGGLTAIIGAIQSVSAQFTTKGMAAASEFADAAGKVIGIVDNGVKALEALRRFQQPSAEDIGAFKFATEDLVQSLGDSARVMGVAFVANAAAWADGAGKALGLLGGGIQGLQALRGFQRPAADEIGAFKFATEELVRALGDSAQIMSSQFITHATIWMEAAGKALGLLGSGVQGLQALQDFQRPTAERIGAFKFATEDLLTSLSDAAHLMNVDAIVQANLWMEAALRAVDVLGKGIGGFTALRDFRAPSAATMADFVDTARRLVDGMAAAASTIAKDGIAKADDFSTAALKAMSVVGNGIDGFLKFKDFIAPSKKAIDDFVNAVHYLLTKITEMAGTLSKEGLNQANLFSNSAQAALTATKTGTDAFKAMEKLAPPSKEAIDNLVIAIEYVMKRMSESAIGMGTEGLANAVKFAVASEQSSKAITGAIEAFKKLNEPPLKGAMEKSLQGFKDEFDRGIIVMAGLDKDSIDFQAHVNAFAARIHDALETLLLAQKDIADINGLDIGGPIFPTTPHREIPDALPHFALGGVMGQAGLALVGERGPELVYGPGAGGGGYGAGARVYAPNYNIYPTYKGDTSPIGLREDLQYHDRMAQLESQIFLGG